MTELIAKPVVKNKMWIVESAGTKVGNIMTVDEGGVVYIHDDQRELFPSIKLLSKKYSIEITKLEKQSRTTSLAEGYEIHGYTTPHRPHNILYDVQKHLPIYTKTDKSKSYFCAGYYIIKFNHNWAKAYCPKAITLNRYEYQGPFRTQEEMLVALRTANGQ